MDTNWHSFLATAALLVAAVSILYRRQKKNSSSKPSPESNSSLSDFDSSTRPLPAGNYEVFLSFRGPDVRTTFADSLYHFLDHSKIRTFFDDEGLRKGEKIAPSLVQAIQESKIYIPILSQGYASSKWCLEELSLMVKSLNQNQGHILLPIFYFVEPRDVRRQEGSYSRAFRQHSRNHDAETVKEWKEALQVVSNMKGWHVTESDGQGAVIDKIFSQVWSHLMGNYRIVTDELIGVESHVKEVRDLLDLDSKGVKIVGIYGMGGIGKTTISKAVYNDVSSRFERSCFLEDIRETLLKNDGAVTLQNKIISSIMRHDSHVKDTSEGIHIIRDKVCKYKVLIVLDNVDRRFEFDNIFGNLRDFSIESRFIMTTRDIRVLDFFEECRLFEAKVMTHIDSFQLFRKHAFGVGDHQEEKEILCEEFVKAAAGLPLALKVIGSLLFRKEKRVWQEKLEELKERPSDTRVHEILKISYNDLTPAEKDIFLDIACFFVGKTKELPFYMWNDCKFYPESSVSSLILRSLLRIDERNQFWMHDHIRDLGRAIVREENIQQSWKRSRIWSEEEALDMLENGKGNDKVEVLRVNLGDRDVLKLTDEEFRNLSGVRFLEVRGGRMTGDFSKILPNIRWLQLCLCRSIPTDVNLKKVIILNLEGSYVRDDWKGWKRVKEGKKLKVVNLRQCEDLVKAPDLSSCGRLEVINLELCTKMGGELHIGNFKNLKLLRLSSSKITELKGDIQMLQDLEEIDASNLTEMPAGIGNVNSLEILMLILSRVELPALPTSLKKLWLSSPSVPNLLELKDLEDLCFQHCHGAPEIPGDIWLHLTKLKKLTVSFSYCKSLLLQVESVADSVAKLPSSLNSLVVSCMQLETLPDLANLSNLIELRLRSVQVDEIHGVGQLKMLEAFAISDAPNLKSLDGLENLVLLQRLTVVYCGALEKLPSISNLTKLHTLVIRSCWALFEIQGLDVSMGESSLTHLEVSCCPKLASVEDLLQSMQALQTLKLTNFQALETLLLRLSSLSKILHLAGLGKLHVITILGCQQLTEITGFDTLQSLEELDISYCTSIQKLSGLSTLKNLKNLRIWSGRQLTEMEELDLLESLERLELHRCTSMKKLPNLCHLKKLNCLSISECRSLTSTEDCGIDGLNSLQRLNISWCTSILKLPNLCGLTKLTNMDIIGCTKVTEVMGLERLESLVRLKLNDCASIVRLPDLSALKNLTLLNISGCTQLTEVTGLESLESLQVLAMSRCKSVSKLPDLSILEYLRYLNISKCTQLKEVIGVERLEWLELLAMSQCKSIKQLPDLSGLKYLKHLDIRQCRRLTEIKGLQELKSLEVLGVHDPISAPGLMDGMSELHQKYLM
ncbi:unnamed protein product [Linum tenue]|uniref:TIR domain-containing protein n=1 Tax=Linum tenue TaxID=586396 RepID=A0AAV0KHD2_9ROSI|nr:unnamed protein product [Linum tenue]